MEVLVTTKTLLYFRWFTKLDIGSNFEYMAQKDLDAVPVLLVVMLFTKSQQSGGHFVW